MNNNSISINSKFLENMLNQGWLEIENLQRQINSLKEDESMQAVSNLLTKLLTSYYIFVGGLESLTDNTSSINDPEKTSVETKNTTCTNDMVQDTDISKDLNTSNDDVFEPFEYFVDFDEPSGIALTDEDLYN